MLTFVTNFLYYLLTRSRLIYRLIPVIMYFMKNRLITGDKDAEKITDEGGATMKVTRYNGKVYPAFGVEKISKIKDFTVRHDDVILCGYPKTGCHWVYEILYMLRNQKAKLSSYGKGVGGMVDAVPHYLLDSVPSPRVLNSHVLYEDLPTGIKQNKTKIILTVRSPKDTVVSFFNHTRNLHKFYDYDGEFNNYFKMFMKGQLDYGCYFDFYLSWKNVIKSQNNNEIFLLKFEELKKDSVGTVMKLAEFLGTPISRQLAGDIVEASKFNNMKSKHSESVIFRKGVVGDWKNWLTDDQIKEIDSAWKEKKLDY